MKYLAFIFLSSCFMACANDGAGGYDETKGTTEVDRTDTLNRESPYNTPGSTESSTPSDKH